MRLDPFKLAHWVNARKYTVAHAAALAGVAEQQFQDLLRPDGGDAPDGVVASVAAALRVEPGQLATSAGAGATVVCRSGERMRASRRCVRRDGIDFYNYYTLASPEGSVAPVVLDILCPAGRLPALNRGHLEPAITVNLGPGHIHGRWGEELTPDTWQVLEANTGADRWITGDSYVEPSYCPHAYSLVDATPARIVSYTGQSNLAGLLEGANGWSGTAFGHLVDACEQGFDAAGVLDQLLARRLHDRASAARLAGVAPGALRAALEAPLSPAGLATLRALARELGFDYRVLLPPEQRRDAVGKTCATVATARASARRFSGYEVASMASDPALADLAGAFVEVVDTAAGGTLRDCAATHYFVVAGELTLEWADGTGRASAVLTPDGSAWVAPFVDHAWRGRGALLKFGSGRPVGSQDWLELTGTYAPAATLRRGHRDLEGWGYDG